MKSKTIIKLFDYKYDALDSNIPAQLEKLKDFASTPFLCTKLFLSLSYIASTPPYVSSMKARSSMLIIEPFLEQSKDLLVNIIDSIPYAKGPIFIHINFRKHRHRHLCTWTKNLFFLADMRKCKHFEMHNQLVKKHSVGWWADKIKSQDQKIC